MTPDDSTTSEPSALRTALGVATTALLAFCLPLLTLEVLVMTSEGANIATPLFLVVTGLLAVPAGAAVAAGEVMTRQYLRPLPLFFGVAWIGGTLGVRALTGGGTDEWQWGVSAAIALFSAVLGTLAVAGWIALKGQRGA